MKQYRENNKEKIIKIKEKYKNTHSRKIPNHLKKPRKPKMTEEEKKIWRKKYYMFNKEKYKNKRPRDKKTSLPTISKDLFLYKEFLNEKNFPKNYDEYCIKKGLPIFVPYAITENELKDLTGWIRHW